VYAVLEAIRISGKTTKVINLSSAAVYGNPTILPVKENCPANPVSPYGWHKLESETICNEFIKFIMCQP